MDALEMQRRAAERTQELPGTLLTHPFGEEWDVWKVRGKVFMLQTVLDGEPIVTVKARPADSRELQQAIQSISPGYHMNKKHRITLRAGPGLDAGLLEDLVTESYLLVVENLPKRLRPVDIDTLGGCASSEIFSAEVFR